MLKETESDRLGEAECWPDVETGEQAGAVSKRTPEHRSEDYDEGNFGTLLSMQRDHFWYRGRHDVVLRALESATKGWVGSPRERGAIDLGGGCGGWLEYLRARGAETPARLALGDSSPRALELAASVVGDFAECHHVDLLDLPWKREWHVVFLLDVLEHVEDHERVLLEVYKVLRPGGVLILTAPALMRFWTYNDVLAGHHRRYSRCDLAALARGAGLRLVRSEYFMFLLGVPLYFSRILRRVPQDLAPELARELLARTHRVPAPLVNRALGSVLAAEASLMRHVRFPWGTSVLGVFERPAGA